MKKELKEKKQNFSRAEVRALLKNQVKSVRNSIGRMDMKADDLAVLNKISKCKIVAF